MRRNEKEIREKSRIEAFLDKAPVCRIGMVDEGRPYIVPVHFVYERDRIYFHSAHAGRKISVLQRNPVVCVEADEYRGVLSDEQACDYGTDFVSVIAEGTAVFVKDMNEKNKALSRLMAKYADGPQDFSEKQLESVAVIRIDLQEVSGKSA
ncbi:MAG: pyridoxamine 5'-phosphate oxidase family protein [Spirochaetales bacterium]|nr:pyridoxamine 5'-phosphate oxidase family protein [Spirochaetales bacterium]MCF7939689.1 pyridoxamine 5'-phosphate oxidase family protein [Spirochaetales bacterium]